MTATEYGNGSGLAEGQRDAEGTGFGWIRKLDPSLLTMLIVVVGSMAAIAVLVLISSPISDLFGGSQMSWVLAIHGLAATMFVLAATISLYLAWRLYLGDASHLRDLKWLSGFSAAMSFFTIVFGNWVYTAYRAKGGAKSVLLVSSPDVHNIFFEFKEHLALFTLPIMVGAAFALWYYDKGILTNKYLRAGVALAFLIGWVALMVVFALGAEITKLSPVH